MKFIVLQNKNIINHGMLKKTLVGTPERRLQLGEGEAFLQAQDAV